ncbi:hypothetical protein M0R45_033230 [Rubus argutus]|uniref:Protein kinase domain-containing protein n=1 Tax=Rubus argutus TaxID=59490 RepID=A0AAW1WNL5_RUBAR
MKSILTLLYLFLFVYFVSLFVGGDWAAPVEDIAVTCGSDTTDTIGSSAHRMAPDNPGRPYDTARLSNSEFTYRFDLTTGQKFVRLYFYPVSYANFARSQALFSVKAGDFTLVDHFNASATADAAGEDKLYREFCLNIDEQQSLRPVNITFTPSKDAYAFINGIEIVSMPTSLYYSAPESDGFQYVGGGKLKYRIENSASLETFYRLDIGRNITKELENTYLRSTDDQSNMYRKWDYGHNMYNTRDYGDGMYLDDFSKESSVQSYNYTIRHNFVTIPEYSAPENVYLTGRTMVMNNTINKSHKLTWKFPVDSSFHYLVRLHFCEFESHITRSGDRKFQIELANRTVEEGADIIQWSGGKGIPIYRDYVVYMSSPENEKKVNLSLSLAAFQKDGVTSNNNPILNGLEILKLLDSNGSSNAAPQVKSPKRSNKSTPTLAVVAGVVASILVFSVVGFLVFKRGWRVKDSRSSHRMKNSMKTHKSSLPTHLCRYFSLAVIKAATENFNVSSIIGVGGFGNVYKGWIDSGATVVAIKRLKPESSQAKVSDFGLSKGTTNVSKTHISTLVKGSFGYLDPEYFRTQHLTEKSDVYSFGVVLCEVLCARPAVIPTEEIRQASLAEWTKSCYHNGELYQIIDPSLRGKIASECLNKFTEVAISCMNDNGTDRPSMNDVVRGLEFALQLHQSAEGDINCIERNIGAETSSSEQSCATNDSIKCASATIFSEINNPSGR